MNTDDATIDQPDETNGVDAAARRGPRPWLGVRFDCCNVYIRVYRNRDGTAYAGRCPSCGRAIHVPVGPDGCSSRFFIAS